MTRRFREREGPFGGRYWEDEEGNKIHEREGPFGGQYTEDDEGRKVEERTGPFGGRYAEDGEGGRSQEAAGPEGSNFVDVEGKRTRHVTGAFGERQVVTDSDTPILPERPARPPRFSLPRYAPSGSSSDDAFSGIAFLLGALFVLVLVFLFLYIGLPILAGVWLARFANRRWVEPVADRHRWRWAILPAAFAAGALPTNELVATGFGALQCHDPQSVSCADYRRNPTPTVLGLHRWIVQRDSPIVQPAPTLPSHSVQEKDIGGPSLHEEQLRYKSELELLRGAWNGTYVCGGTTRNFQLILLSTTEDGLRGIFRFSARPAASTVLESGSFLMTGSYAHSGLRGRGEIGSLDLKAASWIEQPTGYSMVNLSGSVYLGERKIEGSVAGSGCDRFALSFTKDIGIDDFNQLLTNRPSSAPQEKLTSEPRHALVCLSNRTASVVNYSYRWGDGQFEAVSISPGSWRSHWWSFDLPNSPPQLEVRFDNNLLEEGSQERGLIAEPMLLDHHDCGLVDDRYSFRNPNGRTLDLLRGR